MMATVGIPAVLRIVQSAVCAEHQAWGSFVHLPGKLDHPSPLCVDRVFSRQMSMIGTVALPNSPKVRPMKATEVVFTNQINSLAKISFRFRRQLAQRTLPVGSDVSPAVARTEIVPPACSNLVLVSEIHPALGQI